MDGDLAATGAAPAGMVVALVPIAVARAAMNGRRTAIDAVAAANVGTDAPSGRTITPNAGARAPIDRTFAGNAGA